MAIVYRSVLKATFAPKGSTVIPANDIQIWLLCAGIDNKAYTTISEVLNDTTTLFALISSQNAVDYMVRSTSWCSSVCADQTAMSYIGANDYCSDTLISNSTWLSAIVNSAYMTSVLNVYVPTMTSNTTPSGECSCRSKYATQDGYLVFDKSNAESSYWESKYQGTTNQWVQYMFETPVKIKLVKLTNRYRNGSYNASAVEAVNTFEVLGSNTGEFNGEQETLISSTASTNTSNGGTSSYFVSVDQYKKYIRFNAISTYGSGAVSIGELQFYGRA